MDFWSLICKVKLTCMPITSFIFILFFHIPILSYPSFLVLSRGIRIAILTRSENGRRRRWKNSHLSIKKSSFWNLFSEIKATLILTACIIFWFFIENALFFSFLVVVYDPNRGWKWSLNWWKNDRMLIKNVIFKLNFQDEGQLDTNFLIFILFITNAFFISSLVVTYECTFSSL